MPDHAVLTADDHRNLRVRTARGAALGDAVMSTMVVPTEFRNVAAEYPILFQRNPDRDGFTALAMFGFDVGENLYLADDRWDARYVPLSLDIQPFLIGRPTPGNSDAQVHVDLASPRLDRNGEGIRLFDALGLPTPYLEAAAGKLSALDEGYRATAPFFAALDAHRLLEPTTLEITLADGSTNRLVGFHAIDEARLRDLDATALGALHAAGHLMPIFMAVASIGQLSGLIARKSRRAMAGG